MNKSKSMAVAAAALAMCLAGSAFAQDRRDNDRDGRRDGPRAEQGRDHGQGRDFDRRGGHGDRGDRGHRGFRGDYREGRQFDRPGYPNPHSEWRRGGRVPSEYRSRNYVVDDWRGHRLQQPPRGYQWVGVGGDYVLAAIATGLIAQIIAGQ